MWYTNLASRSRHRLPRPGATARMQQTMYRYKIWGQAILASQSSRPAAETHERLTMRMRAAPACRPLRACQRGAGQRPRPSACLSPSTWQPRAAAAPACRTPTSSPPSTRHPIAFFKQAPTVVGCGTSGPTPETQPRQSCHQGAPSPETRKPLETALANATAGTRVLQHSEHGAEN